MHNSNSNPTLMHCSFLENQGGGGGIVNERSSPLIVECTFVRNDIVGIYNAGSSPTLVNSIFSGHSSAGAQTLGQALKLPPVPAHSTQRNRCGFAATLQNRRTSQGIR